MIDENRSVIIDVTDTYFGGKGMEGEYRRGKDEKVKKLVQIALAVTKNRGFPPLLKTYGGNISDRRIFVEMISKLKERGYSSTVMDRRDIYSKENRVSLKKAHVFIRSTDFMSGKLIVVYNPKVEQIRREHYYEHSSDEEAVSLLGYSLICHNTSLSSRDAVGKYYAKDTIESAFKHMKGVLSFRLVMMWMLSHVYPHIKICYLSYAVLSMLQYRKESTGISGEDAVEILNGVTVCI